MKTLIPAFVFIFLFVGCEKEEMQPDEEYGLLCTISVSDSRLNVGDNCLVDYRIENTFSESFNESVIFGFHLLDNNDFTQYDCIVFSEGTEASYTSGNLIIARGDRISQLIDITDAGWTFSIASTPPDTEFYELIDKGDYELRLFLEIVRQDEPNKIIHSNKLKLKIK